MRYIVLTGGIASGKSSVSNMLLENGISVVDADKIAHEVLDEKADEITNAFGREFVKEGRVDRKKLGELIFKDKSQREILESILHENIYQKIKTAAASLEKQKKLFVVDIPLFFEKEGIYKSALTAVVYAPKQMQIARLMQRSKLTEDEARLRVAAQLDIEQKRAKADVVIDNSKDLAHLKKEVEKFIAILKERHVSQ
ncbi:MAG: dephospho-CoA kinase [Campylobacteraceae bacterium]|jgi:dephospho-CoA kinase|nr:dephospho-CoA kinase [Campylobacteraceae bacterium]